MIVRLTLLLSIVVLSNSIVNAQDTLNLRSSEIHRLKSRIKGMRGKPSSYYFQEHERLDDGNPHYVKIFRKNGTLLLEGELSSHADFHGEIRFYDRKSRLRRIEHYHSFSNGPFIVEGKSIESGDGNMKCNIWKSFGKQGVCKMESEHVYAEITASKDCESFDYSYSIKQRKFNRHGEIKTEKSYFQWRVGCIVISS